MEHFLQNQAHRRKSPFDDLQIRERTKSTTATELKKHDRTFTAQRGE
ncbi:hypothetical protein [Flavobacterium sp. JP2137]